MRESDHECLPPQGDESALHGDAGYCCIGLVNPKSPENVGAVMRAGCTPVLVDLIEGATSLPDYVHPARAFYIFGPEDGTLDPARFKAVQEVIYVPTRGCMNLAASVNVILYDRLAKRLRR